MKAKLGGAKLSSCALAELLQQKVGSFTWLQRAKRDSDDY
jgi:hypothetical protein